jgi:hypothetical protein
MPLDKRWNGRRVTRARCLGELVLVRLSVNAAKDFPREWLTLTQEAYRGGLTVNYSPSVYRGGAT